MSSHSLTAVSSSRDDLRKEKETRSCAQNAVAYIIDNRYTEGMINFLVCSGVIIMIVEADNKAPCVGLESQESCISPTVEAINVMFLSVYTVEASGKLFINRWKFFASKFNCLDLFVVGTGLFTMGLDKLGSSESMPTLPNLQMLRMFRMLRLTRNFRILRVFPELTRFVNGFISAMSAMAWGLLLILCLLVFFAIICVEVVHPLNVEHTMMNPDDVSPWCEVAFASVFNATMLFFQTLVAGDSWGQCVIPLVRLSPGILVVFITAFALVQVGFMNLILSVVVDSAAQAREKDQMAHRAEKHKQQIAAVEKLGGVLAQCDMDKSGEVTLSEMMQTYDENLVVEDLFECLTIERDDMEDMFTLMDTDESGSLSSKEFVKCIRKAEMQDMKVQMMLLSLQLSQVYRGVVEVVDLELSNKNVQADNPTKKVPRRQKSRLPSKIVSSSLSNGDADICKQANAKPRDMGSMEERKEEAYFAQTEHLMELDQALRATDSRLRQGDALEDQRLLPSKVDSPVDLDSFIQDAVQGFVTKDNGDHLSRPASSWVAPARGDDYPCGRSMVTQQIDESCLACGGSGCGTCRGKALPSAKILGQGDMLEQNASKDRNSLSSLDVQVDKVNNSS